MQEAHYYLHLFMNDYELRRLPFAVFANKQDDPDAFSAEQMIEKLKLDEVNTNNWRIFGVSAKTGDGIYEGLDWFVECFGSNKKVAEKGK